MAFENSDFNFSTADKVEGTIQDKIDSGEINNLTNKEITNLRVDIDNAKHSYLRVRDSEGNIIGKLHEGDVVSFSDFKEVDTKFGKKIFLHIKADPSSTKGDIDIKGWVSADYITGDVNKIKEQIQNNEPVTIKFNQEEWDKKSDEYLGITSDKKESMTQEEWDKKSNKYLGITSDKKESMTQEDWDKKSNKYLGID